MKTFNEAINAAIAINMSKRFNDVQSVYNAAAVMLIADLYGVDVSNVSKIYSEALIKAHFDENKRRKDERRAASRAANEERRLANLAKKETLP